MIFEKIDFHNVEEMIPSEHGYRMARVPSAVRETLNERARENASLSTTGVELRFKILSGEADIFLYAETAPAVPVFLYYGYMQCGWTEHAFPLHQGENQIHLSVPAEMAYFRELAEAEKQPFSPDVIRLVLPSGDLRFLRAEGDITPPEKKDLPEKTLLCYGSSITHGSLSVGPAHNYVFKLGRMLNCDTINLGFAGSAHLEKTMAEYIISRKDWDFATFEMGVNMIRWFTHEEFEGRVSDFISVLRQDSRPIFTTSIFSLLPAHLPDMQKVQDFRGIVRKYQAAPFVFTEGEALLHEFSLITADMVHPSAEGQALIAQRWGKIIAEHMHIETRF